MQIFLPGVPPAMSRACGRKASLGAGGGGGALQIRSCNLPGSLRENTRRLRSEGSERLHCYPHPKGLQGTARVRDAPGEVGGRRGSSGRGCPRGGGLSGGQGAASGGCQWTPRAHRRTWAHPALPAPQALATTSLQPQNKRQSWKGCADGAAGPQAQNVALPAARGQERGRHPDTDRHLGAPLGAGWSSARASGPQS